MVRILPGALWHVYKKPEGPRVTKFEYIDFRYRDLKEGRDGSIGRDLKEGSI